MTVAGPDPVSVPSINTSLERLAPSQLCQVFIRVHVSYTSAECRLRRTGWKWKTRKGNQGASEFCINWFLLRLVFRCKLFVPLWPLLISPDSKRWYKVNDVWFRHNLYTLDKLQFVPTTHWPGTEIKRFFLKFLILSPITEVSWISEYEGIHFKAAVHKDKQPITRKALINSIYLSVRRAVYCVQAQTSPLEPSNRAECPEKARWLNWTSTNNVKCPRWDRA